MKIICQNRKAHFEYHIEQTLEAGIALKGSEVKSLKVGGGNISDAHMSISSDGPILQNFRISPYKFSPIDQNHDPLRNKQLLLHKHEIKKFYGKVKEKGMTIVVLSIYINKKRKIKVELALAKGKKMHDKRDSIKKKDMERDRKYDEKYS